jgi:carbon storage regulator CsrA
MSLVLSRRVGETIVIGDDITVTVAAINGQQIRFAINAPPDVVIDREEVHQRKLADSRRIEIEQVKGLYVLEFTPAGGGQPICWIAAGTSKSAEELFQREFPDRTIVVDYVPVWDWVMACYIGTQRERPGDAEIYRALLLAAGQAKERPFIVPMPSHQHERSAD